MALTEFQSKKLLHLFRTIFDNDHNGTIEKADFDMVADKICKMRTWSPQSAEYTAMHQRLTAIWDDIKSADADGDGQISEKEWLKLWADVVVGKQNVAWIKQYQDLMFDAQDISGDGNVDEKEYTTLYTCLGIPAAGCKEAFQKLTNGSSGVITKDVFQIRFQEFIASQEPSALGNFLFGCASF